MIGAILGLTAGVLFGRFFTPDDYFGNWYGFTANFWAHVGSAAVALCLVTAGLAYFDAVPTQAALAMEGAGFSIGFQAVQWWQGGTLRDSISDAIVMSYGWVPPCFAFKVGPSNLPSLQAWWPLVAVAIFVMGHWALGVRLRVRQARQLGRNQ